MEIGVLGAGVVGLSTALAVQTAFPTATVTVVAEKFCQDTTSDGAAGVFRPATSFCVLDDHGNDRTKKIINDSYAEYAYLTQQYSAKETGVQEISGYLLSSTSQEITRNPLLEGLLPEYRSATQEELAKFPGNYKYGSFYTTVISECRQLLPFYMQKFEKSGGKIRKGKFESVMELADSKFNYIFNCLGLGAKTVFNDRKLVPIRGQVIKVSAPWQKHFVYSDYDTYIIPGMNGVTLGGCRNYDSWDLKTSPYDSAAILERCSALVPKLKEAPVLREWVGLRPHRDPVRIQADSIHVKGKTIQVIHNYGHGGYGVTAAPGSALEAVRLFQQTHRRSSKL